MNRHIFFAETILNQKGRLINRLYESAKFAKSFSLFTVFFFQQQFKLINVY